MNSYKIIWLLAWLLAFIIFGSWGGLQKAHGYDITITNATQLGQPADTYECYNWEIASHTINELIARETKLLSMLDDGLHRSYYIQLWIDKNDKEMRIAETSYNNWWSPILYTGLDNIIDYYY